MKTIKSSKDITTLEVGDVVVFGDLKYTIVQSQYYQRYYLNSKQFPNIKIFDVLNINKRNFIEKLGINANCNCEFPETKSLEALTAIVSALFKEYEKEKELTWNIIKDTLKERKQYISLPYIADNNIEQKTNVLLKLINIRNYFGKPDKSHTGYIIDRDINKNPIVTEFMVPYMCSYSWPVFAKREHAEQALKILGKEVTYLFLPW